jgi:hypothetical protein
VPFFGLGLHIIVAIFFAIHAIRSGQQLYWLIILFSFPLLGSIVYAFAIYLPSSKLDQGARKVANLATKVLDPGRELREARSAFEFTPTAQNQMRLASALLEGDLPDQAAKNYEQCLQGPFASDLEIRLGAARAYVASGRYVEALEHLEHVREQDPNYRAEQVSISMAKGLAGLNRDQEAGAEFESCASKFGSFDSLAEYAIWAKQSAQTDLATRLYGDTQTVMQRWNKHTRELNKSMVNRLMAAFKNT